MSFLEKLDANLSDKSSQSDNTEVDSRRRDFISSYKTLLIALCKRHKQATLSVILSTVLMALFNAAIAIISANLYSKTFTSPQAHMYVMFGAGILLITGVAFFSYMNNLWIKVLNINVVRHAMPNLWKHILSLPLKSIVPYMSGDVAQRLVDYEMSLGALVRITLSSLFSLLTLLFLFFYMAWCDLALASLYLCMAIVYFAIKLSLFPANLAHYQAQFAGQGKLSAYLNEVFLQIHKIRTAYREAIVYQKWLHFLVKIKLYEQQSVKIEMVLAFLESSFPLLTWIMFYAFIYFSLPINTMHILQLMVCAGQFSAMVDRISNEALGFIHFIPPMRRIHPWLTLEIPNTKIESAGSLQGDIRFSHVSYKHPESGQLILDDIELHVAAGEFVGIVGESGSGKSTLFKLLLGFDQATTGLITLDHENILHYQSHPQMGVVLQTSHLFAGTIFSNLTLHKALTLEEAWELAHCVGLAADIERMPMKMHTYISDNPGDCLSGGQKQKLILARALANSPRVLLLDEATSALDAASQKVVVRHLRLLNITRMVIAHRHSTLKGADKIYRMSAGKARNVI